MPPLSHSQEKTQQLIRDIESGKIKIENNQTNIDAIQILRDYPQMLEFKYFNPQDAGASRKDDNLDDNLIVVHSPFPKSTKPDEEVCKHVEQVVALLAKIYDPVGLIRVILDDQIPKSCHGPRVPWGSGGSKSRRTRRRKHNRKTHHKHARKTHHKRKHHSRSRSHSRAARKHKKYSRRH